GGLLLLGKRCSQRAVSKSHHYSFLIHNTIPLLSSFLTRFCADSLLLPTALWVQNRRRERLCSICIRMFIISSPDGKCKKECAGKHTESGRHPFRCKRCLPQNTAMQLPGS